MNLSSRRLAAAVLASALVAGVGGVTTYASAQDSRTVTAAGGTVRLVVGVKHGTSTAAPVRRLSAMAGVDTMAADAMGQDLLAAVDARTVEVPAGSQAAAIAALSRDPSVTYVEVARRVKAFDVAPDDPMFAEGHQPELARLNVPAAWETTTGSAAITVAVVDTGVTVKGDLIGAVLGGWDFINRDNKPDDDYGHGTLVASLIAARSNNNAGMAGVCWSCRILPVKVLAKDGSGTDDGVAKGIIYATDKGAKIINLSLGGADKSEVLRKAVAYANTKGVLVVAAAGNDGSSKKHYPAAYPGVLAVGGTDPSGDVRATDSNYGGTWVDVAAPYCDTVMDRLGDYHTGTCGTSFSTPLVAGIAALVKAHRPAYTGWSLNNAVTRTARPMYDGDWARFGLVNAAAALDEPTDGTAPRITGATPAQGSLQHGVITVGATGATDTWSGVDHVSLYVDGAYAGRDDTAPYAVQADLRKRTGPVSLQWRVYDRAGNSATFDRTVVADNTKPTVSITSGPKNKAKLKGTVKLAVKAADTNGISRVELLINGKKIRTDKTSPYAFSFAASKQPKKMKARVRAYDRAGNVTYTATRKWTR